MTCDSIRSEAALDACAASTAEWAFLMVMLTFVLLYGSVILLFLLWWPRRHVY